MFFFVSCFVLNHQFRWKRLNCLRKWLGQSLRCFEVLLELRKIWILVEIIALTRENGIHWNFESCSVFTRFAFTNNSILIDQIIYEYYFFPPDCLLYNIRSSSINYSIFFTKIEVWRLNSACFCKWFYRNLIKIPYQFLRSRETISSNRLPFMSNLFRKFCGYNTRYRQFTRSFVPNRTIHVWILPKARMTNSNGLANRPKRKPNRIHKSGFSD